MEPNEESLMNLSSIHLSNFQSLIHIYEFYLTWFVLKTNFSVNFFPIIRVLLKNLSQIPKHWDKVITGIRRTFCGRESSSRAITQKLVIITLIICNWNINVYIHLESSWEPRLISHGYKIMPYIIPHPRKEWSQ